MRRLYLRSPSILPSIISNLNFVEELTIDDTYPLEELVKSLQTNLSDFSASNSPRHGQSGPAAGELYLPRLKQLEFEFGKSRNGIAPFIIEFADVIAGRMEHGLEFELIEFNTMRDVACRGCDRDDLNCEHNPGLSLALDRLKDVVGEGAVKWTVKPWYYDWDEETLKFY